MTRPQRPKFKSLYLWHRYTGLICAILVLVLAVTGLLLQHGKRLALNETYVASQVLLAHYGIAPNPVTSYNTQAHWLSHAGTRFYLDGKPLPGEYNNILGAAETAFGYAVVSEQRLVLFDKNGQLIEVLAANTILPEPALGIGSSPTASIVMRGGKTYWVPDNDFLAWKAYQGPHPVWVNPEQPPQELLTAIQAYDVSQTISMERLLLDLHSGRLLGKYGVIVMDLAAIGLLLLSCSGIWVWLQRRKKDRAHHSRSLE